MPNDSMDSSISLGSHEEIVSKRNRFRFLLFSLLFLDLMPVIKKLNTNYTNSGAYQRNWGVSIVLFTTDTAEFYP